MLASFAEKTPFGRLLAIYNAALILIGGGVLCFARFTADPYSPVPLTAAYIVPVAFAWAVALFLATLLFLYLKYFNRLQNIDAVIMFVSFLELGVLGYATWHVFTESLRNHRVDQHNQLIEVINKINKNAAKKTPDDFIPDSASLKGPILIIRYGNSGRFVNVGDPDLRAHLLNDACPYLNAFSGYKILSLVEYIFSSENGNAELTFGLADCNGAPQKSQTPAFAAVSQDIPVVAVAKEAAPGPEDSFNRHIDAFDARIDRMKKSADQFKQQLDLISGSPNSSLQYEAPSVSYARKIEAIEEQIEILKQSSKPSHKSKKSPQPKAPPHE